MCIGSYINLYVTMKTSFVDILSTIWLGTNIVSTIVTFICAKIHNDLYKGVILMMLNVSIMVSIYFVKNDIVYTNLLCIGLS